MPVFSGGLVATAAAMLWYLRRHHLSFWSTGDLWAPSLALGQAIGRIGCYMAGCCYGRPTGSSWGVVFTHPKSLAHLNLPLYPTQVFEAFAGFAIFLVLISSRKMQIRGTGFPLVPDSAQHRSPAGGAL